ncbi:hypothetical protein GOV05_05115 [Candidatus Woesearchaeota archaeon]|nr:hypothetical protein [Candidatus Woesearchaeota archaeon]
MGRSVSFIVKAYEDLIGEEPSINFLVRYSKAFQPYNANVKYTSKEMTFSLSHLWKQASQEIKIGLIQSLMIKVFKPEKKKTLNTDLYHLFIKNAHIGEVEKVVDPILKVSFDRLNNLYFNGMLDSPNIKWGEKSFSQLGRYAYASDTITISQVLRKDQVLLEYVLYHEMLHKKLKYKHNKTRSFHHTKEFKDKEKLFYEKDVEEKLKAFLRKERVKNFFGF